MSAFKAYLTMDDKDYWRSEKIAFLALCQLKGIGYWTLRKWADAHLSFKAILRDPVRFGFEKSITSISSDLNEPLSTVWNSGLAVARKLASLRVTLIFNGEDEFPERLRTITDPPAWLFVQGKIDNLYGPTVGVVGTREPTPEGVLLTRMTVASLHGIDISTVSGLAIGIDQAAHIESLNCGIPTIAVLGTGILENYPRNSQPIRAMILSGGGTIVTEYLPNQGHSSENFVRRNRIQAALSDVLIPTEWKVKSGTAHTVRFARTYGKRVFSVILPYEKVDTPEVDFITKECRGMVFVLPGQSDAMCHIIKTLSEIEGGPLIDVEAPEHLSLSEPLLVSDTGEELLESGDIAPAEESGQLPLI